VRLLQYSVKKYEAVCCPSLAAGAPYMNVRLKCMSSFRHWVFDQFQNEGLPLTYCLREQRRFSSKPDQVKVKTMKSQRGSRDIPLLFL
jgi:hypothetical protein